MYRRAVLVLSAFLLTACAPDKSDDAAIIEDEVAANENSEEPIEETKEPAADADIEKSSSDAEEQASNTDYPLTGLVNEKTFVDTYALQAWEDYQEVISLVTYGDITAINVEEQDFSGVEGVSKAEVDDRLASLDLRDDVYMEQVEVSDIEFIDYYRYPAEEDSDYSEISAFLAELSFYYLDDNLMFSSITPGFYEVELNDLPEADVLTSFFTVEEIEEIDPQVFTIAEMNINGKLIRQIMIAATHVNDEGVDEPLAFYYFTHNEDIIQYAYLPFEMVMQSFPDYSLMLYQELLPTIQELEL